MNFLDDIKNFLQKLHERYGKTSTIKDIVNRYNEIESTPPEISEPPTYNPPTYNQSTYNQSTYNQSTYNPPTYNPPIKNKFTPINIASAKEWAELRAIVLDLHEFNNFFAGKQDSQSPQFIRLIENYKNAVEKKLFTPSDSSDNFSYLFAEKLSEVIKNRFKPILQSYSAGLCGKGKESKAYYKAIEERVKKYFSNIGLNSANVRLKEDYRKWLEHMNASVIPAPYELMDNQIAEVSIQPHYFEYYDDEGEIDKFWIDGECTVYKWRG